MESSDSSLSSDWDIVNSPLVISEKLIEESPNEVPSNEWPDTNKDCPPMGSGVDDVNEADISHHNDSNSSSDIDVIEETAEDLIHSTMSIPQMEYSISPSLNVASLVPTPAPVPDVEEGWNHFLPIQWLLRNPQVKDYLIIIFISIVIASTMHLQGTPVDKMKEMKEQVEELKKENFDLKNRVISSKIEDDKLFLVLEDQVRALKIENLKLSDSLQSLINHLEEQTAIFKRENEKREKDPYKNEIDKLKEQVNVLQIDNDELQKQLVRMRYGTYSFNTENSKEDISVKKEVKPDKNDDANENSSDVLSEEIENLKKKLYSEVDELKDWKETINNLIERLNEKEKEGTENKGNFENRKTDEKFRKHSKDEKPEQQFYDWSWKDLKKNLKDTFDNINVSDMFQKYANVDEKKVKGVFESVGHYFKKAQEKTKKILNFNGKDEVWDFLGDLRKKWSDMKNEYFETHHKDGNNGPVPPDGNKNEQKRDPASGFSDKSQHFEDVKKGSTMGKIKTMDPQANKPRMNQKNPKKEQILTFENIMNDPKLKSKMENRFGPGWQAEMKKFLDEQYEMSVNEHEWSKDDAYLNKQEQSKKPEDSWMFRRAAVRSVLREHDNQEDSTNWFLRKKKTTKGDLDNEFYDVFEEQQ